MSTTDKEIVYVNRYIGVDGVAFSEEQMAAESIKRAQQKLLQENGISTQDSLRAYPDKNASIEQELLNRYAHLNDAQKLRHIQLIQKSMGLEPHDKGDGVPSGTAEKNRQSLKDTQKDKSDKMPRISPKVRAMFDGDETLTDEFKQAATEVFEDAVSRRTAMDRVLELLTSNPELKLIFATDDQLDLVERMSEQVSELEESIAERDQERRLLLRKESLRREALREEALYSTHSQQERRRSTHALENSLYEVDEGNRQLFGETSSPHGSMRRYVEALDRSTRNVDRHGDNESLLETWKLNN